MSRYIFSLLIRSGRLQQEIATARKRGNPNWLRVLRLQNLRLMLQKRIYAIATTAEASFPTTPRFQPIPVSANHHTRSRDRAPVLR